MFFSTVRSSVGVSRRLHACANKTCGSVHFATACSMCATKLYTWQATNTPGNLRHSSLPHGRIVKNTSAAFRKVYTRAFLSNTINCSSFRPELFAHHVFACTRNQERNLEQKSSVHATAEGLGKSHARGGFVDPECGRSAAPPARCSAQPCAAPSRPLPPESNSRARAQPGPAQNPGLWSRTTESISETRLIHRQQRMSHSTHHLIVLFFPHPKEQLITCHVPTDCRVSGCSGLRGALSRLSAASPCRCSARVVWIRCACATISLVRAPRFFATLGVGTLRLRPCADDRRSAREEMMRFKVLLQHNLSPIRLHSVWTELDK